MASCNIDGRLMWVSTLICMMIVPQIYAGTWLLQTWRSGHVISLKSSKLTSDEDITQVSLVECPYGDNDGWPYICVGAHSDACPSI